MAQHFFDLRYSAPGGTPSALKGGMVPPGLLLFSGPTRASPSLTNSGGWLAVSHASTGWIYLDSDLEFSSGELLLAHKRTSVPLNAYSSTGGAVLFRASLGTEVSDVTGYYASVGSLGTSSSSLYRHAGLYRVDDGSYTQLGANSSALATRSFPERSELEVFTRVSVSGGTFRSRVWWEDQDEPTTWHVTATDNTYLSGKIGLVLWSDLSSYVFRFLSVGTDGDPAPMEPPGGDGPRLVQGTVFAPDDTPVGEGYSVRCYHRETGMLLGETTTSASGTFAFVLAVPQEEPLNLVAIDTVGNVWGSPSLDRVGGTED